MRNTPDGQDSLGALWVPLADLDRHRLSPLAQQALAAIASDSAQA